MLRDRHAKHSHRFANHLASTDPNNFIALCFCSAWNVSCLQAMRYYTRTRHVIPAPRAFVSPADGLVLPEIDWLRPVSTQGISVAIFYMRNWETWSSIATSTRQLNFLTSDHQGNTSLSKRWESLNRSRKSSHSLRHCALVFRESCSCKIWSFHVGDYEDFRVLARYGLWIL
jgi:hypothetical protein